MHISVVTIHVRPEDLDGFIEAALDNARNSLEEPGVYRFDFIQQANDPTRFILYEVYRDAQAAVDHKQTAHYLRWKSLVDSMMAEPRVGVVYHNLFPDDQGAW